MSLIKLDAGNFSFAGSTITRLLMAAAHDFWTTPPVDSTVVVPRLCACSSCFFNDEFTSLMCCLRDAFTRAVVTVVLRSETEEVTDLLAVVVDVRDVKFRSWSLRFGVAAA